LLQSGLLMGHAVLSASLKAPRLAIDEAEAEKLAAAVDAVLSHYVAIDVDPKTRDWMGLIMVAGSIYGPRVLAAMMEVKPRERQAPAPQAATELKPTVPQTQIVDIAGVGKVEVPVQ